MTKIDLINAKILKELLVDGRKSFTEIAKECNTSKDVITKRYKRMKKEGIIVGATIQNSCACLGCKFFASININIHPHKGDQVLKFIKKLPITYAVVSVGIGSLVVIVKLKSIEEIDQVKQLITKVPFVLGASTYIWTGARNTPENLSMLQFQETVIKTYNTDKKTKTNHERRAHKIDKIDSQIIEKLAKNGRIPFSRIAEELKISADTVARRYKNLQQNGDLKVVIQINPTKIGYHAFATIDVACVSQDTSSDTLEAITKISDVNFIMKTSGDFDFRVIVMISDIKRFIAIQDEITKMPNTTKVKVSISKLFTAWPFPREAISTF